MMFFNRKSEIDKIREEINDIIAHFEKCNTMINDRVTRLSIDANTINHSLENQIKREVAYIDKRIDDINNDIKTLINIGIALVILVTIFVCFVAYTITH